MAVKGEITSFEKNFPVLHLGFQIIADLITDININNIALLCNNVTLKN